MAGPFKALGCVLCTAILVTAGICTWRFGPWYETTTASKKGQEELSTGQDLTALASTTCPTCCNGLESNCDLPVNQILFPTVHNAHSSFGNGFVAANNNQPLEAALVSGYRSLMLDSCMCDTSSLVESGYEAALEYATGKEADGSNKEYNVGFCHHYCNAGVRVPSAVFANIQTFLEVNPNEVLIIEFEILDNSLADLYAAIDNSGLDQFVYRASTAPTPDTWPTLQQLIDANTRILLFAHGDQMQSCSTMTCPEGIFYTYDHFAQTVVEDTTNCDSTEDRANYSFFLMNHWKNTDLDLPSKDNSGLMNGYNSLDKRFGMCSENEHLPNFIAVDFWDLGDVVKFVSDENAKRAGNWTSTAK